MPNTQAAPPSQIPQPECNPKQSSGGNKKDPVIQFTNDKMNKKREEVKKKRELKEKGSFEVYTNSPEQRASSPQMNAENTNQPAQASDWNPFYDAAPAPSQDPSVGASNSKKDLIQESQTPAVVVPQQQRNNLNSTPFIPPRRINPGAQGAVMR